MSRKSAARILLCNDDGINAPGLYALSQEMRTVGDVTVVAPDSEKSAVGHAITLADPLRVWEFEKNGDFFGYAVSKVRLLRVRTHVQEWHDENRTATILIEERAGYCSLGRLGYFCFIARRIKDEFVDSEVRDSHNEHQGDYAIEQDRVRAARFGQVS